MLSAMRGGKNNMVVWGLLGLLVLGLVGFGANSQNHGYTQSIGTVGDQKLSANTYSQTLYSAVQNTTQQAGRALSPAELEAFGVQRNVLNSILASATLDNETQRLAISIGDEAVANDLRATRAFQGLDGEFDRESYEFALERSNVSAAENEDLIRATGARALLQAAVANGNLGKPDQAHLLLDYAREARDFEWVALDAEKLPEAIPAPSDAQLTEQYEAEPELYTLPETRNITYAWLTPEMLEDKVSVDDAQLRESYDLQTDRFNKPPRLALDRIVFPSVEEATAAITSVNDGTKTFDVLLSDRNLEARDAALGTLSEDDLSTEVAGLLFGQTEPGIYGPVESSLGPALFRINAIIDEQETSFEEARDELFAELAGEEARRMVSDMVPDIDDLLAAGATLEELAADTDAELGKIDLNGDTREVIAGYDAFRNAAASVNVGDFPEVIGLADGGIFALRLDGITEPTLQPLEDVRDAVTEDWKKSETLRRLMAEAERIKTELDNNVSFADLDLVTTPAIDITRESFLESLPLSMVLEVFELDAEGDTVVVEGADKAFIGRLNAINSFDAIETANAALLEQVNAQIAQQRSSDILTLFTEGLQNEAGVRLNQAAINSINSQILLHQ